MSTRTEGPGLEVGDGFTEVELPSPEPPFRWRQSGSIVWLAAALPGAQAAFSTRLGGVSGGAFRSLNLGILTDDDPDSVMHNRRELAAALGRDPHGVAMGLQVHGAEVRRHAGPPAESGYTGRVAVLPEADAHASAHPAVTPLVLVADCVPLVLSSRGAVAAVHCGWRGVVAGIVGHAVQAVREEAGRGASLAAAIGPGIRGCCYEVGPEVREAFREQGFAEEVFEDGHLRLPLAVRHALERAGVPQPEIADSGLCSSCNPALFFSHRRDGGRTGRQAGLAWQEP